MFLLSTINLKILVLALNQIIILYIITAQKNIIDKILKIINAIII